MISVLSNLPIVSMKPYDLYQIYSSAVVSMIALDIPNVFCSACLVCVVFLKCRVERAVLL